MVKSSTPRCRRKFCRQILTKKVNFEQKIIFINAKMFQLHLAPHRQDDHIWGPILSGWRRRLQDPRDKEGHVLGCPGWRLSADPLLDGERERERKRENWRNSEAFYRLMEALQGSLRPSEAHWGPSKLSEALWGSQDPLRPSEAFRGPLRPSKTLWSPPRPSKSFGRGGTLPKTVIFEC